MPASGARPIAQRDLVALVLLVLAVAIERAATIAARVMLPLHLSQSGVPMARIGVAFGLIGLLGAGAPIAGGLVALALGPRATGAIAAAITAAGWLLVAVGAEPNVGAAIAAIGAGMFLPCPLAAGAAVLTAREDAARGAPGAGVLASVAALAALFYAVGQVAAALAPVAAGAFGDRLGLGAVFAGSGALALAAAALAGGAALLERMGTRQREARAGHPYRHAEAAPAAGDLSSVRGMAGLAIFAGAALVLYAGQGLATPSAPSYGSSRWVLAIGPLAGVVASVGLFGAAIAAAIHGGSAPSAELHARAHAPAVVFGAGLALAGAASLLFVVGGAEPPSVAAFGAGSALVAMGSAAVGPVGSTYAAVASSGRFRTLILGAWFAITAGSRVLTGLFGAFAARRGVVGAVLFAALCLAAGVAIAARARRVHRLATE